MLRRLSLVVALIFFSSAVAGLFQPTVSYAASNLAVGGASTVTVGETVNITITVNTGGESANAFQGNFSYPANLFEGVRGTFSGSICTLPISQPEPDGGSASFSCGRPSGFSGSGTVATIVLKAIASGSGSFGLSGCQVLANDGQGTDITGGCSGRGITVAAAATPTPAVAATTPTPASQSSTPTPGNSQSSNSSSGSSTSTNSGSTPKPTSTPKASATPSKTPVPSEQPQEVASTPEPTPPPVESLPPTTPTPETVEVPVGEVTGEQPQQQATGETRTIAQAIQDILQSSKDLSSLSKSPAGVIALMITTIPFLALTFAILFLGYRLYMMERRRRRTLDRLFEMELSELAALEGKLDLLAEKGAKGREQYKEEFKKAKENILRQLKPGYDKPIDGPAKTEEPVTPKEK